MEHIPKPCSDYLRTQKGLERANPPDGDFSHLERTRLFIPIENIHTRLVVTLSAEELGTMYKSNL